MTVQNDPLGAIPDPAEVRVALGQRLRETAMLRRLLRLAEAADRERQADKADRRQEVACG